MKFDAPFSAGFGSPENWLIRVEYVPVMAG